MDPVGSVRFFLGAVVVHLHRFVVLLGILQKECTMMDPPPILFLRSVQFPSCPPPPPSLSPSPSNPPQHDPTWQKITTSTNTPAVVRYTTSQGNWKGATTARGHCTFGTSYHKHAGQCQGNGRKQDQNSLRATSWRTTSSHHMRGCGRQN